MRQPWSAKGKPNSFKSLSRLKALRGLDQKISQQDPNNQRPREEKLFKLSFAISIATNQSKSRPCCKVTIIFQRFDFPITRSIIRFNIHRFKRAPEQTNQLAKKRLQGINQKQEFARTAFTSKAAHNDSTSPKLPGSFPENIKNPVH